MADLSNLRKRRGAAKASIAKLTSLIKQLESKFHEHSILEIAKRLVPNLNLLDARFKEHHFSIIDLVHEKDDATLAREQDVLTLMMRNFQSVHSSTKVTSQVFFCL